MSRMALDAKFSAPLVNFSFIGLILLLPYGYRYTVIMVVILITVWLFQMAGSRHEILFKWRVPLFLMTALFSLYILSLFVSDNLSNGLSAIERSVFLIVFPLIFFCRGVIVDEKFYSIFRISFVVSALLSILICWGSALFQLYENGDSLRHFFNYNYSYKNLDKYISLNGVHYALFILMAVVFCLDRIKSGNLSRGRIILLAALIALFSLFLFHLGSRMGILCLAAIIFIFVTIKVYQEKNIKHILIAVFFLALIPLVISQMSYLKTRVLDYGVNVNDGRIVVNEKRFERWRACLNLIADHWLVGVGYGDAQVKLMDEYNKMDLTIAVINKYNAHNQFLQFGIGSGVIGVLLYLAIIGYHFYFSIKVRSFVWFSFVVLIVMVSITESLLERQKSVIFFSLCSCILIRQYKAEET